MNIQYNGCNKISTVTSWNWSCSVLYSDRKYSYTLLQLQIRHQRFLDSEGAWSLCVRGFHLRSLWKRQQKMWKFCTFDAFNSGVWKSNLIALCLFGWVRFSRVDFCLEACKLDSESYLYAVWTKLYTHTRDYNYEVSDVGLSSVLAALLTSTGYSTLNPVS